MILLNYFIGVTLVSLVNCCDLPLKCLSFMLTCPMFASWTRAAQCWTVLMSIQHPH